MSADHSLTDRPMTSTVSVSEDQQGLATVDQVGSEQGVYELETVGAMAGKRAGTEGGETGALAAYIRWRLEELGITPTELADKAEVSRSTVYRLLGERPPELVATAQLHRLAGALGVDAHALAELWHGLTREVHVGDDRDALVRAFMLSTRDLSADEIKRALDVARAAVKVKRPPK